MNDPVKYLIADIIIMESVDGSRVLHDNETTHIWRGKSCSVAYIHLIVPSLWNRSVLISDFNDYPTSAPAYHTSMTAPPRPLHIIHQWRPHVGPCISYINDGSTSAPDRWCFVGSGFRGLFDILASGTVVLEIEFFQLLLPVYFLRGGGKLVSLDVVTWVGITWVGSFVGVIWECQFRGYSCI